MYGATSTEDDSEDVETGTPRSALCKSGIVDYSEPCLLLGVVVGVIFSLYAGIEQEAIFAFVALFLLFLSFLSCWRVRVLGVAYSLMDSVANLTQENKRLEGSVQTLETQMKQLDLLKDALGDSVDDFEAAKNTLLGLYEKYRLENTKFEANNLLSLFNLVDKDADGSLAPTEIDRLKEYVRVVYKTELDLGKCDTDANGTISLAEFVRVFRERKEEAEADAKEETHLTL